MTDNSLKKLYYSIGEVSRILQLDQHVIRYWETEFKELNPRKRKNGKRLYQENDIDTIRIIKKLLYDEKYTIEGARRKLSTELKNHGKTGQLFDDDHKKEVNLLTTIRKDLLELRELISN